MEPWQYILVGAILFVGSVIQSAAGFAFALFAVPLLVLMGLPAAEAIAMVAVCATMQAGLGAFKLRREPAWRTLAWMIPIAVAFQPVGAWVQSLLAERGPAIVKQTFGGVLLAVMVVQWTLRPQPRDQVHAGWAVLAMVCSGLMSGLAGMSGPPIVLWVMAHRWPTSRVRATLWASFVVLAPTNIAFQAQRFGPDVWRAALLAIAYLPVVWLGMLPGMWIGARIPTPLMRKIAFGLLVLIALGLIAEPLM